MKRMIGLLMMMALIVGAAGCGDDSNPVKSDADRLVGSWTDEDGVTFTFSSDGTLVYTGEGEEGELAGTWSLAGDKLTITFTEQDLRELVKEQAAAEIDLSELSDAQIEELLDGVMAEAYPDGDQVFILTVNSITDTELTTTDEEGVREVQTKQP